MTLFLLFVLLQEPTTPAHSSEHPEQGEKNVVFTPLTSGTIVPIGNYQVHVPEGLYMAPAEHVAPMYRLARANFIPNCAGIFFANDEDWSFCGVIQHFPYQPFTLQPIAQNGYFEALFAQKNLYNLAAVNGTVDYVMPPEFDEANNTFVIGAHYEDQDKNNTGFFVKKVFVSGQEGIVLSIRADSLEAYQANAAAIDAMLESITSSGNEVETLDAMPTSYMALLGLPDPLQMLMGSVSEPEGLSTEVIATSAVLGLFGILLLVFATRAMKKQQEAEEAESGSD